MTKRRQSIWATNNFKIDFTWIIRYFKGMGEPDNICELNYLATNAVDKKKLEMLSPALTASPIKDVLDLQ